MVLRQGKQNGVVFCEMQGRESSEDDMLDLAMHRLSYPNTGYQYECGGLTPDIATLDNGLVKEYHSRFYRPENAFLLVHGQVLSNHKRTHSHAPSPFARVLLISRTISELPTTTGAAQ